jgi:hypothetical protein
MTEKDFIDILKKCYIGKVDRLHCPTKSGWPDLMFYSSKFIHFAEVKINKTKLTENQRQLLIADKNALLIHYDSDKNICTISAKNTMRNITHEIGLMIKRLNTIYNIQVNITETDFEKE